MMVNNKILEYNHDKVIVEENDDSYVNPLAELI